MPWQREIALVGGELIRDDETGVWVPAYPEVVVTVMRQNGKTVLVLSWMAHRLVLWESWDSRPQTAAYTAQSGSDAVQKFREDFVPMFRTSPLWRAVKRPYFGMGNVGLDMRGGGWLKVLNNSDGAGHGKTIDFAAMDEIFDDKDFSREQAMVPAMATRHDAQKLMTSTAGDETSVLLNAKMDAGRAAATEGRLDGIAYFEYSADPEASDYDPESPDLWRRIMPALGHTITTRTVRNAFEQMTASPEEGLAEFERAWLNVPKRSSGERIIPKMIWDRVQSETATPSGSLVVAADATPEQSAASVVVAGENGAIELIEHGAGTSWVRAVIEGIHDRHGATIVMDARGTLAHLADEMDQRYDVQRIDLSGMVHASTWLYEAIADGKVLFRRSPEFDLAAVIARKRPVSDGAWTWGRKHSGGDISPLVAATLAAHRAATAKPANVGVMFV